MGFGAIQIRRNQFLHQRQDGRLIRLPRQHLIQMQQRPAHLVAFSCQQLLQMGLGFLQAAAVQQNCRHGLLRLGFVRVDLLPQRGRLQRLGFAPRLQGHLGGPFCQARIASGFGQIQHPLGAQSRIASLHGDLRNQVLKQKGAGQIDLGQHRNPLYALRLDKLRLCDGQVGFFRRQMGAAGSNQRSGGQ